MLGLVDNRPVQLSPFHAPIENYSFAARDGKLELRADGRLIETGVIFFKMSNHRRTILDPISGAFKIEGKAPTVFRARFADTHLDLEVWP